MGIGPVESVLPTQDSVAIADIRWSQEQRGILDTWLKNSEGCKGAKANLYAHKGGCEPEISLHLKPQAGVLLHLMALYIPGRFLMVAA